jgi:hypothetical protein
MKSVALLNEMSDVGGRKERIRAEAAESVERRRKMIEGNQS